MEKETEQPGLKLPVCQIISSCGGSSANASCACELPFYVFSFFYRSA
jgi:hypothetical protein